MFRIVEIAERGYKLSFFDETVLIKKANVTPVSIPLDEISAVLLTESANSLSGILLSELGKRNIPLICCDRHYLPSAILSGIAGSGKEELPLLQFKLPRFTREKIWQRLIQSKISGQATILQKWRNSSELGLWPKAVLPGDKSGMEAKAAAFYWKRLSLFPRRDRQADDINILFNYGYTILYAAFAREIAATGLFADYGIWHHHRDNIYNLASDLMEPFRPYIDHIILKFLSDDVFSGTLDSHDKQRLMKILYSFKLNYNSEKHSIFSCVREVVRSFIRCLKSRHISDLILPEWGDEVHVDRRHI